MAVPAAVAQEVLAGPDDAARRYLAQTHLPVVPTPATPEPIASWDLGLGESAVLTFASQNAGWVAVLDDGPARRCARVLGVPAKGTLAVVVMAHRQELTASAAAVMHLLVESGFRLDDGTIRKTLGATVGEEWP